MQKPLFAAVLVVALLLAGCQTPSRPDASAAKYVTAGMRRGEVEHRFGVPRSSTTGPEGYTAALYTCGKFILSRDASLNNRRLIPGQLLVQSLSVLYDTNGLVVKKLHDESLTDIRQEIGWVEVGPILDDKAAAEAKPQASSEQLIRKLGEPLQRFLRPDGSVRLLWLYLRDRDDLPSQPDCRVLEVKLDEQNHVIDCALADADSRQWFWALHALGTARMFSTLTEEPTRPYIYRR